MRVRESPAMMGEEGEEEREIVAGSRDQIIKTVVSCISQCKAFLLYIITQMLKKYCIIMYMYCTYSDTLCCSLSAGKCAGSSYHGNGVGAPCNQSSDSGSRG